MSLTTKSPIIDSFLSSMRNSTISVCRKPCNFSSVFWVLQSWQLELRSTISLFSVKLIFRCLKWKSQCDVRVTRVCVTFPMVFHRLICNHLIIWIPTFSKRFGWQQKVINAFSLVRKEFEMVTLSDSRTSHSDKIYYFMTKYGIWAFA